MIQERRATHFGKYLLGPCLSWLFHHRCPIVAAFDESGAVQVHIIEFLMSIDFISGCNNMDPSRN